MAYETEIKPEQELNVANVEGSNELKPVDELTKTYLEDILKRVRNEDSEVRDEQILIWKKLDYYWNNILDIFYDPVAHDWRVPTDEEWSELKDSQGRIINIFRPHGEAIVAALSVTIPNLIFYPDDAENPDDLEMSRAMRSITELLARHNDATMLFIKSVVVMLCQGTIYGYNYYCQDKKFGTVDRPNITWKNKKVYEVYCENCGDPVDGDLEMAPDRESYLCSNCGYQGQGITTETTEKLPQIVGYTPHPKSSVAQEIFSGLHVKIPMSARKQDDCGYLLLEFQQSTAMLRSIFPERAMEIDDGIEDHENMGTLAPLYRERIPDNTATVSALWIRPWFFYSLDCNDQNKEWIEKAIKEYPEGGYALFINGTLFEIANESMDDHWTISKNPLGSTMIARPMMENAANVQDIRAELVELELQTVEHGIPETFVESGVVDMKLYEEGRNQPGMLTAVKSKAGKNIGDSFFTSKAAILSQEVDPIREHIDTDMQFVIGSFPSVYGGPSTSGSKTASEYAQSKSMALQRLNTTWKILCEFYADFQSRSAIEYANIIREEQRDEKFVKREGSSFINQWIRFTSLTGKVGKVEPEATEQLPASWGQRKEAIFQLIQTGIPELLQLLIHPRNIELVKSATGLQDIYIPGEDARNRQYREWVLMSQGIQVPINPDLDNHPIHIEVLKGLLEGSFSDTLDPEARQLCMMHLNEHQMIMAQMEMAQAATQDSAPEESKKKEPSNEPAKQNS